MIEVAIIAALFAVWWHSNLNDEDGFFQIVPRTLYRYKWSEKWLKCPWCSGAWFSGFASLLMYHDDLIPAVFTAFAAAGLTGLIAMYVQGE